MLGNKLWCAIGRQVDVLVVDVPDGPTHHTFGRVFMMLVDLFGVHIEWGRNHFKQLFKRCKVTWRTMYGGLTERCTPLSRTMYGVSTDDHQTMYADIFDD
jgi:hypothetical protein